MQTANRVLIFPALADFERRYRNDHFQEHGLLLDKHGYKVVERAGDIDSVSFQASELEKARYGVLTHNHPRALPPSGADIALAAEYGLTVRAYGVAPDTGQIFDYTVKMPDGSHQYAQAITDVFDDVLEQAEIELAGQSYGDLQWQRESRHLAVQRLARRFRFQYQRAHKQVPVNETAQREQKRLDVLGSVDSTMRDAVFEPLYANVMRVLLRHAAGQNSVPASAILHVQADVNALVQKTFLGTPDRNGTLAAYHVNRGEVIPRSAYFVALWGLMRHAASVAVEWHADLMRKELPADLLRAYQMATLNPFTESLSEMTEPFDPLHLWTGPDGKQLSDRIWVVAGDMQRKLNGYLTSAISGGKGTPQIAQELEQFLIPGVKHTRVNTPFGNLSYEALRLARTEVAFAHARADSLAAQSDPFVESYRVVTAPRHACCDECDLWEASGPYPKSDMTHLPPAHPSCICSLSWETVKSIPNVIAALAEHLKQAVAKATKSIFDFISPLSKRFVDMLFRGTRL